MLKSLKEIEWYQEIGGFRPLFLNEQKTIVNANVKTYGVSVHYFIYYHKQKPCISFLAYSKGKKLINPNYFLYSAIWIDETLSETAYIEHCTAFVRAMTNRFNAIYLITPTKLKDIRPFLWNGFSAQPRFTYLKKLEELDYENEITKHIKAVEKLDYQWKVEKLTAEVLQINLETLAKLNFIKKKIALIRNFLSNSGLVEQIQCFSCYDNGKLLLSNIVLVDENSKTAYTILLNKSSKADAKKPHAYLYHFIFSNLKTNGYEFVDLMGADMKSISIFKSRFGADLQNHYELSYSSSRHFKSTVKNKVKGLAKKVLNKLG